MQAGADRIEAGVGGVFDEDFVRRFGKNDIFVPVISPVVDPRGYVGSVDFLKIRGEAILALFFLWRGHLGLVLTDSVGDAVVGILCLLALMGAEGSPDGQPRYFHTRRGG